MHWLRFHPQSIIVYNGIITRLNVIMDYLRMNDPDADIRTASIEESKHYLKVEDETNRTK